MFAVLDKLNVLSAEMPVKSVIDPEIAISPFNSKSALICTSSLKIDCDPPTIIPFSNVLSKYDTSCQITVLVAESYDNT